LPPPTIFEVVIVGIAHGKIDVSVKATACSFAGSA
jgi:hypothetical protein